MGSDYTWLLNGIDLDAVTFGLATVTLWRPPISTRRSAFAVPGRHGSIASGRPEFGEPQLTIGVRTSQASQSALEAAVNKVAALLTAPRLVVTRRSGGLVMSAVAELVSADMDQGFLPGSFSAPVAVLAIPGTFFREDPTIGTPLGFAANLTGVAVPHLQGSSGPITDAIVRLKGPHAGVFSITDAASGTGLSQSPVSLSASQYLFLDAGRVRSWFSANPEAWAGPGTDASENLDYPGAGQLQLCPVVEPSSVVVRRNLAAAAVSAWSILGDTGGTSTIATLTDLRFGANVARRRAWSAGSTGGSVYVAPVTGVPNADLTVGDHFLVSMRVDAAGYGGSVSWGRAATAGAPTVATEASGVIDHYDGTRTFWAVLEVTAKGTDPLHPLLRGFGLMAAGGYIAAGDFLFERATGWREWFDGAHGPAGLWPAWAGAAGASEAVLTDASIGAASDPIVRIHAVGGTGRTADTTLAIRAGRSFL